MRIDMTMAGEQKGKDLVLIIVLLGLNGHEIREEVVFEKIIKSVVDY